MRLRITHEIVTTFDPPAGNAIRKLRMTPRTYDGQYVGAWRIDVDRDCRLDRIFDAYGNVVHNFSVPGPLEDLGVTASGEVEVDDTAGVLQTPDRLPESLFLRDSRLTESTAALRAFASDAAAAGGANPLDRCHALMHAVADRANAESMPAVDLSGICETSAAAAFDAESCDAVGLTHVFLVACRCVGIPARFVSGYVFRGDERDQGDAAHVWAEAYVAGLGWVGFDPLARQCPTDAYVRVSSGIDQNGAAFVRGAEAGIAAPKVTSRAIIARVRG